MKVTSEIRNYIVQDGEKKYSVLHNLDKDYWNVLLIEENEEFADRNTIRYFDIEDDLLDRIKIRIKEWEYL